MDRLADKVALITGAAGGIGAAAAALFAAEGAKVVIVDVAEAGILAVADRLGDAAVGVAADISKPGAMDDAVRLAQDRFGGLDIAVLNAGIFGDLEPLADYPESTFDRVMDVNLKGVWHGVRAAIPAMRARGKGSIVINSSTTGLSGYYSASAYSISKHGVIGIMRNAAIELAKENIRVNSVHPGFVETGMMDHVHSGANPDAPEAVQDAFAQAIPMGRYAQPVEIAQLMLFLGSDEASYCTGGCYVADGGLLTYHGGPALG